jgi:hypothetical protein
MELLIKTMEEEYRGATVNLDDFVTGLLMTTTTWTATALVIFKLSVAKYFTAVVFLVNCRNSCYGGETADYFNCDPMGWMSTLAWLIGIETIFNCMLIVYHFCASTSTPSLQSFLSICICAEPSFFPKMNRETTVVQKTA